MIQPDLLEREKGLENRSNKTPNLLRGSLRWAGAMLAGLTALACAQTVEVPSPDVPRILVSDKLSRGKEEGGLIFGQWFSFACPTGSVRFGARHLQGNPQGEGLNAVSGGLIPEDPITENRVYVNPRHRENGVFEGVERIDCYGPNGDVVLGQLVVEYQATLEP